ncbi:WIZ protein, partial [Polypterus senegalus]|nr:protein Wiz-like isoform X3 [Polypterus senegalus]MBN3289758.1 WIZ protein [Polypterus senegalus]
MEQGDVLHLKGETGDPPRSGSACHNPLGEQSGFPHSSSWAHETLALPVKTESTLLGSLYLEEDLEERMQFAQGTRRKDALGMAALGEGIQRTFRPLAFPSAQAWDSDSEKETLDEDEFQHFSNPHGLASHSPGLNQNVIPMWQKPMRSESEEDTTSEQDQLISTLSNSPSLRDSPSRMDTKDGLILSSEQHRRTQSTSPVESEESLSQTTPVTSKHLSSVAYSAPLSEAMDPKSRKNVMSSQDCVDKASPRRAEEKDETKPKDEAQHLEKEGIASPCSGISSEEGYQPISMGGEEDVYEFPGSEGGSPPPLSWASSTLRKTLKPFSGLQNSATEREEGLLKAKLSSMSSDIRPLNVSSENKTLWSTRYSSTVETMAHSFGATASFDMDEEPYGYNSFTMDGGEEEIFSEEAEPSVFTCVECSIYFKKQVHLQEHMLQHCQGQSQPGKDGPAGVGRGSGGSKFTCSECGWEFEDRSALAQHQRLHQESRAKIVEEIRKLNENQDEGNKPSLHCPKCQFGTNSSKLFVEHTKMHIKEQNQQSGKASHSPLGLYRPFSPTVHQSQTIKERYTCKICSFPAPSENILKEHIKYTHSLSSWEKEILQESVESLPGTSKDAYSLTKSYPSVRTSIFSTQRKASQQMEDSQPFEEVDHSAILNPESGLTSGAVIKDTSFQNQVHNIHKKSNFGVPTAFKSGSYRTRVLSPDCQGPLLHPKRKEVAFKSIGNQRNKEQFEQPAMKGISQWSMSVLESMEDEGISSSSEVDPLDNLGLWFPDQLEVPEKAMELKREFRNCLRESADSLELSEEQQNQLRQMVPVVILETLNLHPKRNNKPSSHGTHDILQTFEEEEKDDMCVSPFVLEHLIPQRSDEDFLDDFANDLFRPDPSLLKNMERKCPYCPDRFHNGIGLANHVRGHLNRVGVSYNVRHFISPEEVNAIEQKFSYQKKKKKGGQVANFDPDTFSLMRCEFCSAGFDTRAGLSSHARAHLRDFGITNWEVTVSPINILRELFSNRPDLVFPRGPGASSPSSLQGDEPATLGSGANISCSPVHHFQTSWREDLEQLFCDGGEEDEMSIMEVAAHSSAKRSGPMSLGELGATPKNASRALTANNSDEGQDLKAPNLLTCAVCFTSFETRKGLSSHARSHLRHLGVAESESSGAPIDLLYGLMKQKGKLEPLPSPQSGLVKKPQTPPQQQSPMAVSAARKVEPGGGVATVTIMSKGAEGSGGENKAAKSAPLALISKGMGAPTSPVLKKAPVSSLLPSASPLMSSDSEKGVRQTSSSPPQPAVASKPFWAPQEDDAPLNLTFDSDANKDIVCQLCGAWFETRKGLSSHARAHLRHFGVVDAETKGSPIDYLNELIKNEEFKKRLPSLQPLETALDPESPGELSPTLKRPAPPPVQGMKSPQNSSLSVKPSSGSLHSPPVKKMKASNADRSSLQIFQLSSGELTPLRHDHIKEIGCEFCGEYFENRKGLSSHARSHLRQLGITEWSVNGSPIDTLRDLIKRKGLPTALPLSHSPPPNPKSLHKSQHHSTVGPPSTPGSPEPRSSIEREPSSPSTAASSSSSSSAHLIKRIHFGLGHSHPNQPTARKMMSTGGLSKLKADSLQMELASGVSATSGFSPDKLQGHRNWSSPDNILPLSLASEREPVRDIRCEFCGEYFENRKGLSSHARSHLRQMGITEWTVNGSPIDTLREVMRKKGKPPAIKKEPGTDGGFVASSWEDQSSYHKQFSVPTSSKPSASMLHSGHGPAGRMMKHSLSSPFSRGIGLSVNGKHQSNFLKSLGKRTHGDERSLQGTTGDVHRTPNKNYVQTELPFKPKSLTSPDKSTPHASTDASCELCGFYFENRKALASHARAHLRQFGVTEWCVNGSPIETLSAWIRSKPHKVAEVHRSYLQNGRPFPKKARPHPLNPIELDALIHNRSPVSRQMPSISQGKRVGKDVHCDSGRANEINDGVQESLSPTTEDQQQSPFQPQHQQKGARSELNVRSPRGFERRPPKHPAHLQSDEALESRPMAPRVRTIPSLVPKPPSTPLVKFVGNIYSLKCRFCEVEFHGPLSVQEDWVRHLQQHILDMNFPKSEAPLEESITPMVPMETPAEVL